MEVANAQAIVIGNLLKTNYCSLVFCGKTKYFVTTSQLIFELLNNHIYLYPNQ